MEYPYNCVNNVGVNCNGVKGLFLFYGDKAS